MFEFIVTLTNLEVLTICFFGGMDLLEISVNFTSYEHRRPPHFP